MAQMDVSTSLLRLGAMLCLCALACTDGAAGEDVFPRASDLRWDSVNFKTILTWGPVPVNYSYTVEFSQLGEDRKRNPHCIQTSATECDLTNDLRPLNVTYSAVVMSGPVHGASYDLVEPPYTNAPTFNPYKDTQIGKARFRLEMAEDKTSVKVLISDPLTPLRRADGRLLSIRDIFKQDLQYRLSYNKAGSTGKRELVSGQSQVELKDLDPGESYCFSIAAYVQSRRSLGPWAIQQCSPGTKGSIIHDLGGGVLVGAIFITFTLLLLLVTLLVLGCRRGCRRADTARKEGVAMTTTV